ncbi:hypothetical protein B0T24DRAFT_598168 [Lasiosphaeria ovina]|uniref:Uncharacterized protein n=1 Tax=Lasiosphaeria ovina TaxID=92902 RepID=A0AAE0JV49_9PEZI|nr:hypothetical protein B0T24DRAFT_598168 [Lasiosphaeria ovina]
MPSLDEHQLHKAALAEQLSNREEAYKLIQKFPNAPGADALDSAISDLSAQIKGACNDAEKATKTKLAVERARKAVVFARASVPDKPTPEQLTEHAAAVKRCRVGRPASLSLPDHTTAASSTITPTATDPDYGISAKRIPAQTTASNTIPSPPISTAADQGQSHPPHPSGTLASRTESYAVYTAASSSNPGPSLPSPRSDASTTNVVPFSLRPPASGFSEMSLQFACQACHKKKGRRKQDQTCGTGSVVPLLQADHFRLPSKHETAESVDNRSGPQSRSPTLLASPLARSPTPALLQAGESQQPCAEPPSSCQPQSALLADCSQTFAGPASVYQNSEVVIRQFGPGIEQIGPQPTSVYAVQQPGTASANSTALTKSHSQYSLVTAAAVSLSSPAVAPMADLDAAADALHHAGTAGQLIDTCSSEDIFPEGLVTEDMSKLKQDGGSYTGKIHNSERMLVLCDLLWILRIGSWYWIDIFPVTCVYMAY